MVEMVEKADKSILKAFFGIQRDTAKILKNNVLSDETEQNKKFLQYCSFCNLFELPSLYILDNQPTLQYAELDEIIENKDNLAATKMLNNTDISSIVLPSPWTYIGFPEIESYTSEKLKNYAYGIFISHDMISLIQKHIMDENVSLYIPEHLYYNRKWMPDMVNHGADVLDTIYSLLRMLHFIDSFQTTIIDTRSAGFKLACNLIDKKRQIPRPKAYYRVTMKDGTRYLTDQEINDRLRIIREKTHAYFVKAHNRHRIMRGTLPMDEKMERWLRKDPKRKIFTSQDQIDPESLKILTKRGIFWRDGEWIALLPYRVHSHIANTKGGKNPYIPSIHIVP